MKKVLLVLIIFHSIKISAQEKNCSDFKTGKFKYSDVSWSEIISVRNDSIQSDYYSESDMEIVSKITWLSDCKYKMEYIKVSEKWFEHKIGEVEFIEIVQVNGNKILCRNESYSIEMIKITEQ
ncbi:hypothetical protein AB9K26_00080 [Psychroserpens sp. XS_ASV72]|uniref:hypothetical protein n=1 Tax=Psychroserpens sp. XS_ASV72 TaxID=3241293 RepID=UPI0035128D2C